MGLPVGLPNSPWPSNPQVPAEGDWTGLPEWDVLYPNSSANTSASDTCPYSKGEKVDYDDDLPRNLTEGMLCPFVTPIYPTWEVALKMGVYLATMLVTVVGNLLVIFIVVVNKRMHSSTNYYFCALAASDLLVGLLVMWSHLGTSILPDWPFGACICKAFAFVQMCALTESVLCMTVIALDRFVAIVTPLRARACRHHAPAVISVTWIIAVLVALPNLAVRVQHEILWADRRQVWCTEVWPRYFVKFSPPTGEGTVGRCLYDYPERRIYYTAQVVVMYFVPVAVMMVAYCAIAWTLWKRRMPGEQTDALLHAQQRARKKVVRMLIVVFVAFVVCWTPQEVIVLILAHCPLETSECDDLPEGVHYACVFIAYFNCALNPILYAGLNDNFRKGFREAFKCRLGKHNRVSPGVYSLPHGGATGSSSNETRVSSPTSVTQLKTSSSSSSSNSVDTPQIRVTWATHRAISPKGEKLQGKK